jgi:hypothetical protein
VKGAPLGLAPWQLNGLACLATPPRVTGAGMRNGSELAPNWLRTGSELAPWRQLAWSHQLVLVTCRPLPSYPIGSDVCDPAPRPAFRVGSPRLAPASPLRGLLASLHPPPANWRSPPPRLPRATPGAPPRPVTPGKPRQGSTEAHRRLRVRV